MRRYLLLAVVCLTACSVAGCDRGSSGAASTSTAVEAPQATVTTSTTMAAVEGATTVTVSSDGLVWTACGDAECARLSVPLVHADPSAGTIELAVARRTATDPGNRIGVLLYNPGGPGIGGTDFIVDDYGFSGTFSSTLSKRFDVVSWDPRGTSEGTIVACVDDPERLYALDPTPESPQEMALTEDSVREYATGCAARSRELVPYLSSVATARDMDLLREALGEDQITYVGQSYGGQLGSIYATLFPQQTRAMVLDSALDTTAPWSATWMQVAAMQEQLFNTMMDQCAGYRFCPFHNDGDPLAAFDDLMARFDEQPLIVNGTEVGLGHAVLAVWTGLQDEELLWPELLRALADAQDGDGTRVLALAEPLGELRERFWSVTCLDWPTTAWEPAQADIDAVLAASPRLGPYQTATASRIGPYFEGLNPCRFWSVPPELPPAVTGSGAGPILVIGTTGDVLPFESSRALADRLEQGTLLVVERTRHTAYQPGYVKTRCVTDTVDTYLTDLALPPDNSVCQHGKQQLQPPN